MILSAIGIAIGVLVGAVNGGRFTHIRQRKLRAWGSLPLAIACFAIPELLDNVHGAGAMHTLGLAAIAMFGIANLNLVGAPIVIIGIALNLVPLTFNGVVPVSQAAAVTANLGEYDEFDEVDLGPGRAIESTTHRFVFLGDTIPVAPLNLAVSFGDLIIALGLGNVAFRLLKPRRVRFRDQQQGWPESTVPTTDTSSDPWTAMLRGEIDDSAFQRQTGPQPRSAEPEWVQEPPVTTGPMVLADSDKDPAPEAQPEALDLSLTWAAVDAGDDQVEPLEQAVVEAPDVPEPEDNSPFAPPDPDANSISDTEPDSEPAENSPLFDQDESHKNLEAPGRSFAPELPDMDEPVTQRSDFERALATFDADRRDFHDDDTPDPEHSTGPINVEPKPDEPDT